MYNIIRGTIIDRRPSLLHSWENHQDAKLGRQSIIISSSNLSLLSCSLCIRCWYLSSRVVFLMFSKTTFSMLPQQYVLSARWSSDSSGLVSSLRYSNPSRHRYFCLPEFAQSVCSLQPTAEPAYSIHTAGSAHSIHTAGSALTIYTADACSATETRRLVSTSRSSAKQKSFLSPS